MDLVLPIALTLSVAFNIFLSYKRWLIDQKLKGAIEDVELLGESLEDLQDDYYELLYNMQQMDPAASLMAKKHVQNIEKGDVN